MYVGSYEVSTVVQLHSARAARNHPTRLESVLYFFETGLNFSLEVSTAVLTSMQRPSWHDSFFILSMKARFAGGYLFHIREGENDVCNF